MGGDKKFMGGDKKFTRGDSYGGDKFHMGGESEKFFHMGGDSPPSPPIFAPDGKPCTRYHRQTNIKCLLDLLLTIHNY